MHNIYNSFIVISMSVKTCRDFSTLQANAQVHKFTHLTPETHVPFPQQAVSTHSKTKQHQLRCKTQRQKNTPVRPRQDSKSD